MDQNLNVAFEADANMKIKLRINSVRVTENSLMSIHYEDNNHLDLDMNNEDVTEIPADHFTLTLSNEGDIVLIGFQGKFHMIQLSCRVDENVDHLFILQLLDATI